jgi:hypothetical protein
MINELEGLGKKVVSDKVVRDKSGWGGQLAAFG